MKNETKIYVINALTNMHVGSGDVNYGVIDNLIQRDPIMSLPNINASGLKGALREFYNKETFLEEVFGRIRNNNSDDSNRSSTQGKVRFFEASLLSLPVRSDKAAYLMATSVEVIRAFAERISLFAGADHSALIENLTTFADRVEKELNVYNAVVFNSKYSEAIVEIMDLKASKSDIVLPKIVSTLFGENLAIVSHEVLKELCDDNHLPVIARNNLENGQSKNLWYEQILPKYSRLYFMVMNVDCSSKAWFDLTNGLKKDIFQIGANATIGYGLCKFDEVSNS